MRCLVLIYFNGERYVIGRYGFFTIICAVQSAINEHPTSWTQSGMRRAYSQLITVQRRRLTDEHEQRDVRHTPSPIKIGWCDVVRLLWTNLAPSVLLRHALAYETQRRLTIVVPNRMVGGLPSMGWAIGGYWANNGGGRHRCLGGDFFLIFLCRRVFSELWAPLLGGNKVCR